jgi:polygalacturonase
MHTFLVLVLLSFSAGASASKDSSSKCDAAEFGAKGDGCSLDTASIQAAVRDQHGSLSLCFSFGVFRPS